MHQNGVPAWTFLTNHAQVLVCIANDPGIRLRDIAERVGITERAVHRIVVELGDAGYVTRERTGRRNQYTINSGLPMHDPIARDRDQNVGQLLQILSTHDWVDEVS
jgi:DNA-binding Lrp family transcriptional regulator